MSKKLFVGNLPFTLTQEKLKELFAGYEPSEVVIITNKYSGRSKGFGFVTISDDAQADKAINEMNGKDIEGRAMTVNEARPFEENKRKPFNKRFGNRRYDRQEGWYLILVFVLFFYIVNLFLNEKQVIIKLT